MSSRCSMTHSVVAGVVALLLIALPGAARAEPGSESNALVDATASAAVTMDKVEARAKQDAARVEALAQQRSALRTRAAAEKRAWEAALAAARAARSQHEKSQKKTGNPDLAVLATLREQYRVALERGAQLTKTLAELRAIEGDGFKALAGATQAAVDARAALEQARGAKARMNELGQTLSKDGGATKNEAQQASDKARLRTGVASPEQATARRTKSEAQDASVRLKIAEVRAARSRVEATVTKGGTRASQAQCDLKKVDWSKHAMTSYGAPGDSSENDGYSVGVSLGDVEYIDSNGDGQPEAFVPMYISGGTAGGTGFNRWALNVFEQGKGCDIKAVGDLNDMTMCQDGKFVGNAFVVTDSCEPVETRTEYRVVAGRLTPRKLAAAAPAPAARPAARSCNDEIGRAQAAVLVNQCISVSPATHPPCHGMNPCSMIMGEIKRACALNGNAPPCPKR